jgi:hypothetical protein
MNSNAFFIFIFFILTVGPHAQVPNQPEYVGLVTTWNPDGSEEYWETYATLFDQPTGENKYFFSCEHAHPNPGQTLTFGNGQKGIVKKLHPIRRGIHDETGAELPFGQWEYDLIIGELEQPVQCTPIRVWFEHPQSFVDNQAVVTGWARDGGYVAVNCHMAENNPVEWMNGIVVYPLAGTVKAGYSGSPVYYEDKLIGIEYAVAGETAEGQFGIVYVVSIAKVFNEFQSLFPSFLHRPSKARLEIVSSDEQQVCIKLFQPQGANYEVWYKRNLLLPTEKNPWKKVEDSSSCVFVQEGSLPWIVEYYWDTSSYQKCFFQGRPSQ